MEERKTTLTDQSLDANPQINIHSSTSYSVSKNWKLGGQAALVLICVIAALGVSFYAKWVKPYIVVGKAVVQIARYDAAKVTYQSFDENTKVVAELAGKGNLNQVSMEINNMGGDENNDLRIESRMDDQELFLTSKYGKPELLEKTLTAVYPPITKTKTYKLTQPLWKGEKWLHISFPESKAKSDSKVSWEDIKNSEEGRKFAWYWIMAVKPGKIEKNYEMGGKEYTKVNFGFRKEYLIKGINEIKNMNVDVKVSQINALVKAVKSSDDWDRDLFSVLIDTEGNMRVITMKLPKIDEKALNEGIKEGMGESASNPLAGSLSTSLQKLVWGKENGELIDLGRISFDEFDQVKPASKPDAIVESSELFTVAQTELGPILIQMMGGQAKPSTVTPTAKPQTAKPATVNCIQYKIREGEFASDKCYTKSDYSDLVFYLERYNSAIFQYNGAAAQANVTCGGFSDTFKEQCEKSKQEMQKAESDKQLYAGNVRTVIARGR